MTNKFEATGVVRPIDEFSRIVLPFRKNMKVAFGEKYEIFANDNGDFYLRRIKNAKEIIKCHNNLVRTIHTLKAPDKDFITYCFGEITIEVKGEKNSFKVGDFVDVQEWNEQQGYVGKHAFGIITYVFNDNEENDLKNDFDMLTQSGTVCFKAKF